jgi:hypothetical protein
MRAAHATYRTLAHYVEAADAAYGGEDRSELSKASGNEVEYLQQSALGVDQLGVPLGDCHSADL